MAHLEINLISKVEKLSKIIKNKIILISVCLSLIILLIVCSFFLKNTNSLKNSSTAPKILDKRENEYELRERIDKIFKEFQIFDDLPKFEPYERDLIDLEEAKILYVLTPELNERINSIIVKIQKKYRCSSDDPKIKWYLDTTKSLKEKNYIPSNPKPQKLDDVVPPNPFDSEPRESSIKWKDYLDSIENRLELREVY